MMVKVRTHSRLSFSVQMNRSAHPLPSGARTKSGEFSVVESCEPNDVDPYAYLADTLTRIVDGHLASEIDDLLPWAYPKARPLKDDFAPVTHSLQLCRSRPGRSERPTHLPPMRYEIRPRQDWR